MTRDLAALRGVLGLVDLRRLLRVRLVGQAADGVFQAALFAAVFFNPERATSAGQAAEAFAVLLLPYSVVGPFAGVFLDRWRRQRVLVVAGLVRAALVLAFAVLLAVLGATALPVQLLALVVVSVNRFVLSGLSAALPHVVDENRLVVANSLSTTLGGGAALVGGALAVGLRPLVGTGDDGAGRSALVACLLYAVAALLASSIAADLLGPDERPSARLRHAMQAVARGVGQGARHVRAHPTAARALAAITAFRFFYGLTFVVTLLLYTRDGAIGRGVDGLAQIVTAGGLGGLLAAVITPRATRLLGARRYLTVLLVGSAAAELGGGLPYRHATLVAGAALLGIAAQGSKICVDTLLQEQVDDVFRGRVFSFYDTAFNVSFVAAAGAAALTVPDDGKSWAVTVAVALGLLATALAYRAPPRAAPTVEVARGLS